jgi:hypothetical protein
MTSYSSSIRGDNKQISTPRFLIVREISPFFGSIIRKSLNITIDVHTQGLIMNMKRKENNRKLKIEIINNGYDSKSC